MPKYKTADNDEDMLVNTFFQIILLFDYTFINTLGIILHI